jgi:hypothetical protein
VTAIHMAILTLRMRIVFVSLVLLVSGAVARAQRASNFDGLPDAPIPKQEQDPTPQRKSANPFQTTIQVLGRRSVFFPELAFDRGPLNRRQKLELAVDETVAPSSFLASAFTSGIGQTRDSLHGYGQEWAGYGKRFGSSVASGASSRLFGTFLMPSALHQDPRYFVKLYGNPASRIIYAMSRVVMTRTDDGRQAFNWSNVVGDLLAEGLATSYLPDEQRTTGKTFTRFGVRIGFSALDNVVKEYWPTIFRSLRITKMVPDERSNPGTVTPPPGPPAPPPPKS